MTLSKLFEIKRHNKRLIQGILDAVSIFISIVLSRVLLDTKLNDVFDLSGVVLIFTTCVVSILVFKLIGFYDLVIRYMGQNANILIIKGTALSSLIYVSASLVLGAKVTVLSAVFYYLLILLFVAGARFYIRAYYYHNIKNKKKNVVIYGAGVSGLQLVTSLYHGYEYEPRAFIDDDRLKHHTVVHGVRVFPPNKLDEIINKHDISCVLIALPSLSRDKRNKVISFLEKYPVHIKTIPNSSDLISGRKTVENLQEVDIEDLLGRSSIEPDSDLLGACITNKVVMVTGAGGSIGSELCRQVIAQSPKTILLVESSEYSLYKINHELLGINNDCVVIPFLCSVRDKKRLLDICNKYQVDTIYHAAAFKHVPMVEHNIVEGVQNNIFGTLNVARVAIECNISSMVLISTDKAVRPTNVMGVTKRFSELVLQALDNETATTKFCMVRFGNVLGSSGSVVPLFKEQIESGGPVTVTHPDVIRYFMTITEAVQLVIQAGSMATGGDVFVLDMGDPVKIDDLARRLIKLSGYDIKKVGNGHGIEIVYSGLRPGEKLYEELLIGDGENLTDTAHPRIMRAKELAYDWVALEGLLDEINRACEHADYKLIINLLQDSKTCYTPEKEVCDYLF